jgi:hypothetical protein
MIPTTSMARFIQSRMAAVVSASHATAESAVVATGMNNSRLYMASLRHLEVASTASAEVSRSGTHAV